VLRRRHRGLLEVDSGLAEVILATEGVGWDQERMGMGVSEEEVVQEGVGALAKDSCPLENGEEGRDCLKGLQEVVAMVEEDLVEVEADIKAFKSNDTTPSNDFPARTFVI